MLFIEVQLNFTLPGTFGLTELILAVACAPVAQGGEPWKVSVVQAPVQGHSCCCVWLAESTGGAGISLWQPSYCPALCTQLPQLPVLPGPPWRCFLMCCHKQALWFLAYLPAFTTHVFGNMDRDTCKHIH